MPNGLTASVTAIAIVVAGFLIATSNPAEWIRDLKSFASTAEPILVIVVGSPALVDSVRSAISPERITYSDDYAFALSDERIIAANAEAASDPINHLGWIEREIEMISVVTDAGRRWEEHRHTRPGDKNVSPEDKARSEKIAALINKPTLTRVESIAVLQHMDATGQF